MIEILSSVEFQLSLLLFTALAGWLLAARLNQSAVIGEILVGILIGPAVLGLVTYTDFVRTIAQFGAIVLMFVVGLEFRTQDVLHHKYLAVGIFEVAVTWIAGYFVGRLFGLSGLSSIFLGTALTATSIAITANVMRELGKLNTDVAKAIIGTAVIDDVLGLLALSISSQAVEGSISYLAIIVVIVKALAFFIGGLFLGNLVFRRTIIRIDTSRIAQRYPEFIFVFALMVALLYGVAAELAGLSAIVGAFIAGISLCGIELKHSKSYKEGAEYLRITFSSIFFISLGILADIRLLSPGIWLFLLVITFTAFASKLIGCFLPLKRFGMAAKDAFIVGIGMAPRGEVTMIVALIGLNKGIIGQELYVPLVIMCLLTTIITPALLKKLYKHEHRQIPLNDFGGNDTILDRIRRLTHKLSARIGPR